MKARLTWRGLRGVRDLDRNKERNLYLKTGQTHLKRPFIHISLQMTCLPEKKPYVILFCIPAPTTFAVGSGVNTLKTRDLFKLFTFDINSIFW